MKRFAILTAMLGLAACQAAPVVTGPSAAPSPSASPTAPASVGPTASASTVSGVVYDEDINPLKAVTVEAFSGENRVSGAETGADGRFTMSLPAGTYRIKATAKGMTTREQPLELAGDAVLDFGGLGGRDVNPYFLAVYPEITKVEVNEDAPAGPLTLTLHLSEPLTAESQVNFLTHLEVRARDNELFLRASGSSEPEFQATSKWDAAGQVLTIQYAEPYLASGAEPAPYTVRLTQVKKEEKDPVTQENLWENLRITDVDKQAIGKGRADYAFLLPQLSPISGRLLTDKLYGYSPAERRWNLTHTSNFTFNARRDDVPPGLVSVKVDVRKTVSGRINDVMELRFTEPMRVIKDQDEPQFTRLDADRLLKDLFIVNVSKDDKGAAPQPLGSSYKVERFRFSKTDPTVVYADFAQRAFSDMKWVEVTLGNEIRDPANNKPDSAKIRISGPVIGGEEIK